MINAWISRTGSCCYVQNHKKSGGERVSEEAADQLRRILEEIATKISNQAVDLSVHAGRKTIKAEDIQLAAKNLLNLIH